MGHFYLIFRAFSLHSFALWTCLSSNIKCNLASGSWRSENQSKRDRETFSNSWFIPSPSWRIDVCWQSTQGLRRQSCKDGYHWCAQQVLLWKGKGSWCKSIPSSRNFKVQWLWLCIIFFWWGSGGCYCIIQQCSKLCYILFLILVVLHFEKRTTYSKSCSFCIN